MRGDQVSDGYPVARPDGGVGDAGVFGLEGKLFPGVLVTLPGEPCQLVHMIDYAFWLLRLSAGLQLHLLHVLPGLLPTLPVGPLPHAVLDFPHAAGADGFQGVAEGVEPVDGVVHHGSLSCRGLSPPLQNQLSC